jgi:hypothetical protein
MTHGTGACPWYNARNPRIPVRLRHLASLRGRGRDKPRRRRPGCDSTRSKSALSHEFGHPRHAASARRGRIASGGSHVGCQFNRKPMRDGSREDGSRPNLSVDLVNATPRSPTSCRRLLCHHHETQGNFLTGSKPCASKPRPQSNHADCEGLAHEPGSVSRIRSS